MIRIALAIAVLAAAAAVTDVDAREQPLVVYTRTGGFIGVQDSMRISRDGAVTSTNGDFRLSAKRLATLRSQLRTARFPTLRAKYEADYPIADGFVYGVKYGGRTVFVNEEAKAPVRLRRVVDLLGEIFVHRA